MAEQQSKYQVSACGIRLLFRVLPERTRKLKAETEVCQRAAAAAAPSPYACVRAFVRTLPCVALRCVALPYVVTGSCLSCLSLIPYSVFPVCVSLSVPDCCHQSRVPSLPKQIRLLRRKFRKRIPLLKWPHLTLLHSPCDPFAVNCWADSLHYNYLNGCGFFLLFSNWKNGKNK